MTTAPADQPPPHMNRASDRGLCLLAWGSQALTASVYLVIGAQPDMWRTAFDMNLASGISVLSVVATMLLLWATGMWQEQRRFYHSAQRRLHRKVALLGHSGVLLIVAAAAAEDEERIVMWALLAFFALIAAGTWDMWMRAHILPPEDQEVVDGITAHQALKAAALYDAAEKERRRERLAAIVASLGHQLPDDTTKNPAEQATSALPRWKIPARKHAPLVYFIRNGNRVKIGTTTELKRRIRTLALRPENVVLLLDGGTQLERDLHHRFADQRVSNTEWFTYDGPLVDYVHAECARATRKDQPK